MDEQEFYGLSAQFEFSVSGSTKQNLNFVLGQLGGVEQAVDNLSKTLEQRSLGNQISQQMGDVRSSTRRASATVDQMGDTFKMAQKRLDPLKKEFRALRKEVALVKFGEFGDDRTFRRATTEVRRYVDALRNLESQVEGNTTADREFVATLKQQQRIVNTRVEMQREQRGAAKAQTRKGEFEFLRNAGDRVVSDNAVQKAKGAVDLYAGFDDTMSAVKAITSASDQQEQQLRKRATDLGAKTRFTAQQAAEAETYLGTAGFKTDEILSGLAPTLSLASAGQLDLARASEISTKMLSGFQLHVEQLGHATDIMALTSAAANTNVQEMGVAMEYAAPAAALFGASIEETSALIGVMSNAGISADKAGTASRAAFLKLASPTKGGSAALAEFGISLTDTAGNMRNIIDVMNELNAKLQIDPTALQSLQAAGDNLEEIEKVSQSKQIQSLKDIFGTTAISGVAAALGQINELNRLSLANLGSSSNTEQLVQFFEQTQGLKLGKGEDIFSAIVRVAPDYNSAAQMIKQANLMLLDVNLGTLNKLQSEQLKQYLDVSPNEDLLNAIIQKAPSAEVGIAQINSAMEFLGIEFKEKTSAAKVMATVMEDNLAGSFRALDSALEGVKLSLITPLAPAIRAIADALTQLSLFLANLPQPIQFIISSTAVLTLGLGLLASAIGSAGMTLFGFQQALSVANLASTSLSASLIPLTGFFDAATKSFSGTNSLESFLKNNRTLLNDFESAAGATFAETSLGLRSLGRQVLNANQAFLMLSRTILLSPISVFIISVVLLNALIEQLIPGVNLIGITLGAIAAPFGFIFGLVKGITKAFLDFLGISTSGTFNAIAPIFNSIGNAIQMAAKSFDLFSQKGEAIGEGLGNAIVAPFIFAGTTITNIWNSTIASIRETLRPLADFAYAIGRLLISSLAENSPGPTFQIREKWAITVEYLQWLFGKLKNSAILVNQAFLGIGDVTEDDRSLARQAIFQKTVLTITSLIKQLGKLASFMNWIQTTEQNLTHQAIENLDLLGFTLLTLASLPMTLMGQLRKEAKFIIPELRHLIDHGIPKSIVYALPGLISVAIATGVLEGFERGFTDFLDKLPARAVGLSRAFYSLFDENLKTAVSDSLSTGITQFVRGLPNVFPDSQNFTFTFDFDESYAKFETKLQSTLEFTVFYLKEIGKVADQIGTQLQAALEPILSFQIGSIYPFLNFLPPLIPYFTVMVPVEKAIVELAKSPSVKGLINFFSGTVLPAVFQTLYAISSLVLYVFNAIVTLPLVAITQELTKNWLTLIELFQKYAQIVINFLQVQLTRAFYGVIGAIASLIARIPYIGEGLAAAFLAGINLLVTVAPRYAKLLLRFFPIKQILGLIGPYKKVVLEVAEGILYAFREGLAPFSKMLMQLLNPASAFKLFKLYVNTGGFRKIIDPKMFGLFSINPFDLFFGGIPGFSKYMTLGMKVVGQSIWPNLIESAFPANILTSKITEIMQTFADPLSKARAGRFGLMAPLADILEKTPELKIFVNILKGLLLISPIVQIIGRIALTTMFWYSVLKPLNREMLDAIANAHLFGVSLAPLSAFLGAFRFVVVDGSDALIAFSKQLVVTVRLIQSTFNQLSVITGFAVHEIVAVSSILTNVFKATLGNLLLLIPIGITAALDVVLMALQALFKLMRVKTKQYGDAIVALMHGNIVPLITQIFSDTFGVISFLFQQTVQRVVVAVWRLVKTIAKAGKDIFLTLIWAISHPLEAIRLTVAYLEKQFFRLYDVVEIFVKQLGLDKIIRFAIEYWLQLGAIADVLLFWLGIISPIQFAMSSLVAVAVFLVQEYQHGFTRLDAIISALQHPIDFLTSSLKVLVNFLGAYISPELTEFFANLAEQFVRNIPIILAGIFLIGLVIKRNIASAFMVVVDVVIGFVSTIREAIQSIFLLGDKIKDLSKSPSVQLFLLEQSHNVRSRGSFGGFENPLSYSKDPQQQERAKFVGEQRIAKVSGAINFGKEFDKLAKDYEKYKIDEWKQKAKSKDVQERNYILGGDLTRDDGYTYKAPPLMEEKKNRFGMKSYELTELGRSRMRDNIASTKNGDSKHSGYLRDYVADKSGLNLAYQQYDRLPGAPDELLQRLSKSGSDFIPQFITAFDKAMKNLHIKDAEVDTLIVSRFGYPPSMPPNTPYNPEAFDKQLAKFQKTPGLPVGGADKLKSAISMNSLNTELDKSYQSVQGGLTYATAPQMRSAFEAEFLKPSIDAGLFDIQNPEYKNLSQNLLSSMKKGDQAEFAKAKQEFMLEVAKIQSLAIQATIPDFLEFEKSNKQAYIEAQSRIDGLPPIKTGLDAVSDGVKRLSDQMVASVEESQGKRKNIYSAIFGFTGIPQLVEQFQENRNLIRRIQETEKRTNSLAGAAKADAANARKLRERGLSNLMANSGFNYAEEASRTAFYAAKQINQYQQAFIEQFVQHKNFKIDVAKNDVFESDVNQLVQSFKDISRLNPLNISSIEDVVKIRNEVFAKMTDSAQDTLKRLLKNGRHPNKGGVTVEELDKLTSEVNGLFTNSEVQKALNIRGLSRSIKLSGSDLESLVGNNSELSGSILRQIINAGNTEVDLAASGAKNVLQGVDGAEEKGLSYKDIEQSLGLGRNQPSLRQMKDVGLKNPFAQLKAIAEDYVEKFVKQVENFDNAVNKKIDNLESSLASSFLGPTLAQKIVNPIRGFYQQISKSISDTYELQSGLLQSRFNKARNDFLKLSVVSRINKAIAENKDSRLNSLSGITEMMGKQYKLAEDPTGNVAVGDKKYRNAGRPSDRTEFQSRFLRDLQDEKKDTKLNRVDANKTLLTVLGGSQTQDSVRKMLEKQGLSAQAIDQAIARVGNKAKFTVAEILKIQELNVDKIGKVLAGTLTIDEKVAKNRILNNMSFTSAMGAPLQWLLVKQLAPLIGDTIKDATKLTFAGVKKLVGPVIGAIAKDVSLNFGELALRNLSGSIGKVARVINAGAVNFGSGIERLIGRNFFSNTLHSFADFASTQGKELTQFFENQASLVSAGNQNSITHKIISASQSIFTVIASKLQEASNAISREQGFLPKLVAVFKGVKNFFANLLPKGVDAYAENNKRLLRQRTKAQQILENAPDEAARNQATVGVGSIDKKIRENWETNTLPGKITKFSDTTLAKVSEMFAGMSEKLGKKSQAVGTREIDVSGKKFVDPTGNPFNDPFRYGEAPGDVSSSGNYRSRFLQLREGVLSFTDYVTPKIDEVFANIIGQGQKATTRIADYFRNSAMRSQTAWENAQKAVEGKNWPGWVKAAYKVGHALVNTLNHGAADVTAAAWERTRNSATQDMNQMAESAEGAGKKISNSFIHHLGGSFGNVGKAGMAVGGALTAVGFAAQTMTFSLSNMGLISEETSQGLSKTFEIFTLISTVAGLAAPIFGVIASSLGAIGTIAATVTTGVAGIGGAIAGIVGLGEVAFAPFLLGIAGVVSAVGFMYFAIKNNFLGIGSLAQTLGNALIAPVRWIEGAWQGFVDRFGGTLMPIIQPALDVAQGLINALNHNPTIVIPESWQGATDSISGMIGGLVGVAQSVGSAINGFLSPVGKFVGGIFAPIGNLFNRQPASAPPTQGEEIKDATKQVINQISTSLTGEAVVAPKQNLLQIIFNSLTKWFTNLITLLVKITDSSSKVGEKLDVQAELLRRQILVSQTQLVNSLINQLKDKDRNEKIYDFLAKTQQVQNVRNKLQASPKVAYLQNTQVGKTIGQIGGLVNSFLGIQGGALLPLITGIGSVTAALGALIFVFSTDFMGIRTKVENLASSITSAFTFAIETITTAWKGFVLWFLNMPLVQHALDIAVGLINALNHNPTVVIPESWQGATDSISGMIGGLVGVAQSVGSAINGFLSPVGSLVSNMFSPVGNFFSNKKMAVENAVTNTKNKVVETKDAAVNTVKTSYQLYIESANNIKLLVDVNSQMLQALQESLHYLKVLEINSDVTAFASQNLILYTQSWTMALGSIGTQLEAIASTQDALLTATQSFITTQETLLTATQSFISKQETVSNNIVNFVRKISEPPPPPKPTPHREPAPVPLARTSLNTDVNYSNKRDEFNSKDSGSKWLNTMSFGAFGAGEKNNQLLQSMSFGVLGKGKKQQRLDKIGSDLKQVAAPTFAPGRGKGDNKYQAEIQRQLNEQEQLLTDKIIQDSKSKSLYTRSKVEDLVTTVGEGKDRRTVLTQEGQMDIQKQLARMSINQKGVFAQSNLESIAKSKGFEPKDGNLLDIALRYQDGISSTAETLKGESSEAPTVTQLKLLVDTSNQILAISNQIFAVLQFTSELLKPKLVVPQTLSSGESVPVSVTRATAEVIQPPEKKGGLLTPVSSFLGFLKDQADVGGKFAQLSDFVGQKYQEARKAQSTESTIGSGITIQKKTPTRSGVTGIEQLQQVGTKVQKLVNERTTPELSSPEVTKPISDIKQLVEPPQKDAQPIPTAITQTQNNPVESTNDINPSPTFNSASPGFTNTKFSIDSIKLSLIAAINTIQEAWNNFTSGFGSTLNTLITPASIVGTQLVNLLNHGAADATAAAWVRATDNIGSTMNEMPGVAHQVNKSINQSLSHSVDGVESKINEFSTLTNGFTIPTIGSQSDASTLSNVKNIKKGAYSALDVDNSASMDSMIQKGANAPNFIKNSAWELAKFTTSKLNIKPEDLQNKSFNEIQQTALDSTQEKDNSLAIKVAGVVVGAYLKHKQSVESMKHLEDSGQTAMVGDVGRASASAFELLEKAFPVLLAGAIPAAIGGSAASSVINLAMRQALEKQIIDTIGETAVDKTIQKILGESATNTAVGLVTGATLGGAMNESSRTEPNSKGSHLAKLTAKALLPDVVAPTDGLGAKGKVQFDLTKGAITTGQAWAKTTASISQNINSLVSTAPDQGYELQKAVSEGSPGPTYWIREHWQKTTSAISGWLGELTGEAKDAGDSVKTSLNQITLPKIDVAPITNSFTALDEKLKNTKQGLVGTVTGFYSEIQDKYNTLKNSESIDIGQLFLPGVQQIGKSVSILGGDIVDFAKRASTSLLTLNFGELADSVNDFGGNFMYAIKGIASGFHGLSLSAIAFGLISLTSISPVLLIMGGLLFLAAAIAANFLGARTIIQGLGRVGFGISQLLIIGFLGVRDIIRSVGQIIHGIIKGITTGDFSELKAGVINLAKSIRMTLGGVGHAFGTIFSGVKQILSGVVQGIEQIFPPLGRGLRQFGQFLDKTLSGLSQALSTFRDGESAGERFAEVLIGAVRQIKNFIQSIPPIIVQAFKSGFIKARKFITDFVENAIGRIKEFKNSLKNGISFGSISNPFAGLFNNVDIDVSAIISRITAIPEHIHAAMAEVSPEFAKDLESLGKFFTGFVKRIKQEIPPGMLLPLEQAIASVVNQAKGYIDVFVPYASEKFQSLWESLKTDAIGTILKLTQDATNKFTTFIASLSEKWQKFREVLKSGNLLSGLFDQLKLVGVKFIGFVDQLEAEWRKLAEFLPGLPLFPEVFAELRNLGMAWLLQINTLQGHWLDFTKRIAESPFLDNAIGSVVAFGQKFAQTIEKLRNVQGVQEFTLVLIEQIDKAENAWKRFVTWLNTSEFMPNVFAQIVRMGGEFTAFVHNLGERWDNLRVKFASFEVLAGFFASLKQGAVEVSLFFEKLQNKLSESNAKFPGMSFIQNGITQIWYLSQRFGDFVDFAEQKWHQLSTFLANTEIIPGAIASVEFLAQKFTEVIKFIKQQWQPFTEFLSSTNWFATGFNDLRRMALDVPMFADRFKAVFSDIPGSFIKAVDWITGSWIGFVNEFKVILTPIVDFALNIAQKLINALNHNPTVVIPESWRKAVEMITGFLGSLIGTAEKVSTKLITLFTQSTDTIINAWRKVVPAIVQASESTSLKLKPAIDSIVAQWTKLADKIIGALESIQPVIAQVAAKLQTLTTDLQYQEQVIEKVIAIVKVLGTVFEITFKVLLVSFKLGLVAATLFYDALVLLGKVAVIPGIRLLGATLSGIAKIVTRVATVVSGFTVGFVSAFSSEIAPAVQLFLPVAGRLLRVIGRLSVLITGIVAAAATFVSGFELLANVVRSFASVVDMQGSPGFELIKLGLIGISTAVTGVIGTLSVMVTTFAEAKDKGEEMGKVIGGAVAWVIEKITGLHVAIADIGERLTAPLKFVDNAWEKVGNRIDNVFGKIFRGSKTNAVKTEQAWEQTKQAIQEDLHQLADTAQVEGYQIQRSVGEGSPGTTYWIRKMWDKTSTFVQERIQEIAQVGVVAGEKLQNAMSGNGGERVTSNLHDYGTEQARVTEQVDAQAKHMGELGRVGQSVMLSLGSALSNFAPQLAMPLFMLNDLIFAFASLKEAIPALRAVLLANSAIAVSEAVKANAAGGSAIVLVTGANAAGASAAANASVIGSANTYVAATYNILGNVAQFAYTKIILPLIPFLPMILAVAGGVFLLYQAFKNNFLGIADIVKGVVSTVSGFFGQLFSGVWGIIANVFQVLETELKNIFRTIKDVASIIMQPFLPILELFGIKGGSGNGGLLGSAIATVVNVILTPLRIVAGVLILIIKLVSGFLQTLIKVGGAIINLILLPIRIIEAIIFGVFKGVSDATRIFSNALDMLLLQPAFIAYDVFLQVSQAIVGIGWAITSFVLAPFYAVFNLISNVIQPAVQGLLGLFGAFSAIGTVILLAVSPEVVIAGFMFLKKTISQIPGFMKMAWEATFTTISEKITNFSTQAKTNADNLVQNLATNPAQTIKDIWTSTLDEIQAKMRGMSSTAPVTVQVTDVTDQKLLPGLSEVGQRALPPSSVNPHLQALGLTSMPTNEKDLKAAYKQQARIAHPDVGGSAEQFHAVNDAYENLKAQMAQGTVPGATPEESNTPEKQLDKMANRILPKLRQLGGAASSTFGSIGNAIANFSPQLAAPFYIISDTIDALFGLIDFLPSLKAFFTAKQVATTADAAVTTAANVAVSGSELAVAASAQTAALVQTTGSVEASAASVTQAGIIGGANAFMTSTYAFLASAAKAAYTSMIVPLIPFLPLIIAVAVAFGVMYLAFRNNFLGFGDMVKGVWGVVSGVFGAVFSAISSVVSTILSVIGAIGKAVWNLLILPFQLLVPIIKTVVEALVIVGMVVAGFILVANGIAIVGAAIAFITPIIATIGGVIASVVGFVTFFASIIVGILGFITTVSITALFSAIAPFLPLVLGIVAAAYAIKFAFQIAFAVISGYVKGLGDILSGVFGELFTELGNIWNVLVEVGKSLIEPFQPLFDLFGMGGKGGGAFDFMQVVGAGVQAMLLPLRIVAFVLTTIIKILSIVIQVLIKIGGYVLQYFLLPMRGFMVIVQGIKSVFDFIGKGLANIGKSIVDSLLSPFKYLWGLIQNISSSISGFLSNVPIIGMFFKAPSDSGTQKLASGGLVDGIGRSTSTSDRVPAYLSHGEFVVNASATSDNLRLLQAINEGKIPTFTPSPVASSSLNLPNINDLESAASGGQTVVIENLNFSMSVNLQVENGQDVGESLKDFLEDPRFENAVRQALKNAIEKVK